MTALKIEIAYPHDDPAIKMQISLTVPKKWRPGPVSKLREFALETYNTKHPDTQLDAASHHLELNSHPLGDLDIIEQVIERKDVVTIAAGAPAESTLETDRRAAEAAAVAEAAAKAAADEKARILADREAKKSMLRWASTMAASWTPTSSVTD